METCEVSGCETVTEDPVCDDCLYEIEAIEKGETVNVWEFIKHLFRRG